MCLRLTSSLPLYQAKPRGFLVTGALIVRRSTPLALYEGFSAVLSGIALKLAIRFVTSECSKAGLADKRWMS